MSNPSLEEASPPTLTQADYLPGFKNITIPNIKKLGKIEHLRYWQNVIRVALDCRGLGSLISKTIPRPTATHLRYNDWFQWSILVGKWLVKSLEQQFAEPIKALRPEVLLADEIWLRITTMDLYNGEDRRSKELLKLWAMRRDQYDTIGNYIVAWREQVVTCFHLNLGLGWYAATKLMLEEIKHEFPVICNSINHQIRHKGPDAELMDIDRFNEIVNGILESAHKDA